MDAIGDCHFLWNGSQMHAAHGSTSPHRSLSSCNFVCCPPVLFGQLCEIIPHNRHELLMQMESSFEFPSHSTPTCDIDSLDKLALNLLADCEETSEYVIILTESDRPRRSKSHTFGRSGVLMMSVRANPRLRAPLI
jgi:hypothetical protein